MTNQILQTTVARKEIAATDVCSLELVGVEGEMLPVFEAGAHIDVYLPGGFIRQYSLLNAPKERHRYVISAFKDPNSRGGSVALHELVAQGDQISISAPRNHFPLAKEAGKTLLIAGGIGVTPILCMAEALVDDGIEFEMHYCARSSDRMAFAEYLTSPRFSEFVQLHLDDGPESQRFNVDKVLDVDKANTQLYVCGPRGFMDFVLQKARDKGWDEENLHSEFFQGNEVKKAGDRPFTIRLAKTGGVLEVKADQTVVEALAQVGIEIPTTCGEGICGTCLTPILEGIPDHRDMFLSPSEQKKNKQFAACCSRAKSDFLVLDI